MKKKIALSVNQNQKDQLELSANVLLEKIGMIQTLAMENLNIDLTKPSDAITFIKKYQKENDIESESKQNELLYIKFDKEVTKMMNDYPVIKIKALEMFCTPKDRDIAKRAILYAVSLNKQLKELQGVDFEHFVLNDEFIFNSKIDTRLKDIYTIYCRNKKQVELKEFAEKLKTVVEHALKIGLVSNNRLGLNVHDIIDISTGEIQYQRIATIR